MLMAPVPSDPSSWQPLSQSGQNQLGSTFHVFQSSGPSRAVAAIPVRFMLHSST